MVKSAKQMEKELRERMRGGDGEVEIVHLLNKGEYQGQARMVAKLILKPGCSIGYHVHEQEEEIFYLLSGSAVYNDNGVEKTLGAGEVSIATGGMGHAIKNTGDETVELLAVILTY